MKIKRILAIILVLLLVTGLCLVNAFLVNPKQVTIREEIWTSDKFREDIDGWNVAFFSDLCYGSYSGIEHAEKAQKLINDFQPEVVLFGGDLLLQGSELSEEEEEALISCLKGMSARYGKYAVLGDRDLSSEEQKEKVTSILQAAGFRILSGNSGRVYAGKDSYINIVGIDPMSEEQCSSAFEGVNTLNYTIVLTHCPDIFYSLPKDKCDSVLSGHSLGGQVYLPVISFFNRDEGCRNYYRGKITLGNTVMDITNGLGMAKEKVRFLADSEVVFYQLKRKP